MRLGLKLPRDGATTFGDLIGNLTVRRVVCGKCSRGGQYRVQRLINDRGRDAKVIDWLDEIAADCRGCGVKRWRFRQGFTWGSD
ncbi:MAG TPA: hypothetical protein VGF53_06825 [Pseudolabrys sp.]